MSAYIEHCDEFNGELLHVAPIQPWMNWRYIYDQLNATAHCRVSTVSIRPGKKGLYAIVRILDCDPYLADFLRQKRAFVGPASFDQRKKMWSYWKIGQYKMPAHRSETVATKHTVTRPISEPRRHKEPRQPSPSPSPSPSPQITHDEATVLAKALLDTLHIGPEPVIEKDILPEQKEVQKCQEEEEEPHYHSPIYDVDEPEEKQVEFFYDPALFVAKPRAKRMLIKNPRQNPVKTA